MHVNDDNDQGTLDTVVVVTLKSSVDLCNNALPGGFCSLKHCLFGSLQLLP